MVNHAHNKKLLDYMPLGYAEHEMVYDAQGKAINYHYVYVNPAFCEMTGWQKEAVEGTMVKDLYPDVKNARIQQYQALFAGTDVLNFETYFEKQDAWYQVRAYRTGHNRFVSVFSNITDLKHINAQLNHMRYHRLDTGLLNEHGLLESHIESLSDVTCAYIIINQYGNLQSFYGHAFVERLNKFIAGQLSHYHGKDARVAQIGPSHYVVVLTNPKALSLETIKQTLSDLMKDPITIDGIDFYITLHVGVAKATKDTPSLEALMQQAKMANTHAKTLDHNRFAMYKPRFHKTLKQNLNMAKKLNDAITNDTMHQCFQTIIDTRTNQPVLVESLARWREEGYGDVNPDTFFELAEQSYMVHKLERYLIDKTFTHYKTWVKTHETVKLSLNINPHFIMTDGAVETLNTITKHHGLNPKNIYVEISEKTFMFGLERCLNIIKTLKTAGFMIAIDDFGSKYSTIGLLEKIPYDVLKLDGLFAEAIDKESINGLTKVIINSVQANHKQIVAEKVANKQQAKHLQALGCYLHQGYLYDKGTIIK